LLQLAPGLRLFLQGTELAHDQVGLARILPEIRVAGFLLNLRNPLLLGVYVKDAPS